MRRTIGTSLTALALLACSQGAGESSADQCSNGRDDDGDGMADCADPACRVYAFCTGSDAGPPDAGPIDAAPRPDGAICARAVDVVLSVDVSSSMVDELALLRDQAPSIIGALRAIDPDAQVRLVVFVDDVLAISECAPLEASALSAELEARRVLAPGNRSPVSGTLNVDCPENSLDAVVEAAECPVRSGAARVILHVTDDTFAESPAVLSGPFGGGIVVASTYTEASMAVAGSRVVSLTRTGPGQDCGSGTFSPDVGRGWTGPHQGQVALPEQTGGRALDLDAWRSGTVDLAAELAAEAEEACR
jgi:hypothetical protein